MHARDRYVHVPVDEPVVPTVPPPPEATGAVRRALTRAFDGLATELAGVGAEPGAIEYASWIRLLRSRSA